MVPKGNKEWKSLITKLRKSSKTTLKDRAKGRKEIAKSLTLAIKERLPKEKFGIMLSGGVDSSMIALICKNLKADFICYSVGLEGADDLAWAKKAAKKMRLKLKTRIIPMDEAERIIRKAAKLVPVPDTLSVGVGSVVYSCMEMAKKDKIKVLFGGLGSEEIFAGYDRHTRYEKKDFSERSVDRECWKGLATLWERDMERDLAIAKHFRMKIEAPFLDENVIRTAMSIPAKMKVGKRQKKIILRESAKTLGLPKDVAERKKKAAQYGSSFDNAIKKLAKKRGFSSKKDFLDSIG